MKLAMEWIQARSLYFPEYDTNQKHDQKKQDKMKMAKR
jgi:hypothetical protein